MYCFFTFSKVLASHRLSHRGCQIWTLYTTWPYWRLATDNIWLMRCLPCLDDSICDLKWRIKYPKNFRPPPWILPNTALISTIADLFLAWMAAADPPCCPPQCSLRRAARWLQLGTYCCRWGTRPALPLRLTPFKTCSCQSITFFTCMFKEAEKNSQPEREREREREREHILRKQLDIKHFRRKSVFSCTL